LAGEQPMPTSLTASPSGVKFPPKSGIEEEDIH
jgi:hypothetical protein